jgi:alpha(1,3/1,4) fucosyltransferase
MSQKPTLKIDFSDFMGINKADNFFTCLLSKQYNVVISDKPDLLIYCNMGHLNRLYSCKKLFWTSESLLPDYRFCDFAITCFYLDDPRHLRLPFYVMTTPAEDLIRKAGEAELIMQTPRKFCSFVVTNANPKRTGHRISFFHKLCKYKKVDSGGRAFNNIGRQIPFEKGALANFLREYKFNICFENKVMAGYTTEKLSQAMQARSVPLYCGNPLVDREFNPASFLSMNNFPSEEAFIERIIEIDNDENARFKLLSEPYFHNNIPNGYYDEARILSFFDKILSDSQKPVSHRRKYWHPWRFHLVKGMRRS